MRIFRQTKLGDWDAVFHQMAESLRHDLGSQAEAA
jgi:hypothetical protein